MYKILVFICLTGFALFSSAPCNADETPVVRSQSDLTLRTQAYRVPAYGSGERSLALAPLIDVSAAFLSSRAEKELSVWLLDDIVARLCDTTFKARSAAGSETLLSLFPHLCRLAKATAQSAIPSRSAVVDAFREDLDDLPGALLALTGFPTEEAQLVLGVSRQLFLGIRTTKSQPIQIVAGLPDVPAVSAYCKPETASLAHPACVFLAVGLAARAYYDHRGDPSGTAVAAFAHDMNDAFQKAHLVPPAAEKLWSDLSQLSQKLTSLREEIESRHGGSEADFRFLSELTFQQASAIIDFIDELVNTFDPQNTSRASRFTKITMEAIAAISSRQFSKAVAPLGEVFAEIEKDGVTVPKAVIQYVPAGLELAGASSADDVATTLDDLASPVGAWRNKRTGFMVSIGALVGVSGTYEIAFGGGGSNARALTASCFAPIGIDLSWPLAKSSTIGAFASLFDLGDLVGARIAKNDAADVKSASSNGNAEQIFAPGLYGRLGLGRTPIVLSAGASWSPNLRELTLTSGEVVKANVVRVGAQLSVDLTLFPL